MRFGFLQSAVNLATRAVKSSIALSIALIVIAAGTVAAHEVRPAIADVTVTPDNVSLELQVNLEAFVAGIDLSAVENTDNADQASDYDSLRALSPEEMAVEFEKFWPQMRDGLQIRAGDTRVTPVLVKTDISDEPNVELLRDSILSITASLPDDGSDVTIAWNPRFGPLVMRQMGGGDDAYTAFLRNGEASAELPRIGVVTEGIWPVFLRYIVAGFEHILPLGLDHILFVLGLFFLSAKFKPLLLQVTAFTLAHTVTLALGALSIVNIAPEIVEPLIAASIVYVAVENIISNEMKPWRLAIVFAFGLLHGLGFASVLGDFGTDGSRFVTSLIGFNVGVEFGQLAVLAITFLSIGIWFRDRPWYRSRISNPASILIGLVGLYWFVERISA